MSGAYLLDAGLVPYREALELQRSLAAAVSQRAIPETVVLLEHPPVVTTGRRTGEARAPPPGRTSTSRSSRRTAAASRPSTRPGQLVCYPILDLNRHGKDLKRYVRDLEQAIIATVAPFGLEATPIEGLTGVWLEPAAAQDRLDRRPRLALGDDARLRAQRRPRPGAVHRRGSRPAGSRTRSSRR